MSDEQLVEQKPAEEPQPAPSGEPGVPEPKIPEGQVDTAPDTESLKAEIEKLNEAREKAKRDAEYWRREKAQSRAEYFKSRQEPVAHTPPVAGVDEPRPPRQGDFDDYEKFQRAQEKYLSDLVDHRTNQKIRTWQQEQASKQAEESHQQKMAGLQEKINRGFEKYPDFEDVAMADTVPINQVVAEILADCDNPEDVAYYLGRNRTEAIRLSRMPPVSAAREIARIEMTLKQAPPNPINAIKKVTGAPAPIKPLGSSNTVTRDLDKMSQREFEAEMEKRTGRRF